jgi:hypothetical protein
MQSPIRNLYDVNDIAGDLYRYKSERNMSSTTTAPMPTPTPAPIPATWRSPPTLQDRSVGQKIKLIVYATFAFFILGNYTMYNGLHTLLTSFTGHNVLNDEGFVTWKGYAIMSGIFLIVMTILFQNY